MDMQDRDQDTAGEEELSPSEAARDRRRDRDAEAAERAGMGTGLAKQFKQVLDVQARRAREEQAHETAESRSHPRPKGRRR